MRVVFRPPSPGRKRQQCGPGVSQDDAPAVDGHGKAAGDLVARARAASALVVWRRAWKVGISAMSRMNRSWTASSVTPTCVR